MNNNIVRSGIAALALGAMLVPATGLPAKADTSTTQNILIGAAAAAAVFTGINVERKHQLATTVQGYLPDGSAVYQDGHVVSRNGVSWYPGNYGETIACSNQMCQIQGNGGNYGYGRYGYSPYGSSAPYGYSAPQNYPSGGYYNNGTYNNGNYNNGGYYGYSTRRATPQQQRAARAAQLRRDVRADVRRDVRRIEKRDRDDHPGNRVPQ